MNVLSNEQDQLHTVEGQFIFELAGYSDGHVNNSNHIMAVLANPVIFEVQIFGILLWELL